MVSSPHFNGNDHKSKAVQPKSSAGYTLGSSGAQGRQAGRGRGRGRDDRRGAIPALPKTLSPQSPDGRAGQNGARRREASASPGPRGGRRRAGRPAGGAAGPGRAGAPPGLGRAARGAERAESDK